jgi:hypothetical protein
MTFRSWKAEKERRQKRENWFLEQQDYWAVRFAASSLSQANRLGTG